MKIKALYLLNVILSIVLLTSILANATTNRNMTTTLKEYDPWYDLDDTGQIDINDLVLLIDRIPSSGTPINKTALFGLQDRIDKLNATLLNLEAYFNTRITTLNASLVELQSRVEALETRVPKKGYVSLPPAAFVPGGNTIQTYVIGQAFMKGGPSAWFYAPLQLPQGTIITNMTAYLWDGVTTGTIEVYLGEWNQTKLNWNWMVMLDSGFVEAPGRMVLYNDTIVHSGIDNKNCIYIVSVWFSHYDDALVLYDVFIEYEYRA